MRGFVGQPTTGRVDAFALGVEHGGDRVLGQPVDLQLGPQLLEFLGDGHVPAGVTEADGGGEVQRALAAGHGAGPGGGAHRRSRDLFDEPGDQPGDRDRIPALRQVPRAVQLDQLAAGQLGQPAPPGQGLAAIVGAVQNQHRARQPRTERLGRGARRGGAALPLGDHRLGVGVQCPAHRVLVLLGGMRFRQLLLEEELDPAAVAALLPPEPAVAHGPTGGRADLFGPSLLGFPGVGIAGCHRDSGGDCDDAGDAFWVGLGQADRPGHGVAVRDEHAPAGFGGVEHGQQVRDDLGRRMAVRAAWPV